MSVSELMEKVERIENSDCSIGPMEMRRRLLTYAMNSRLDALAEYVVITGCRSTTAFVHLSHLVKLLKYYEVDYTFLSEETCCGNSFLEHLNPKETAADEIEEYENYAKGFENRNLARIEALGIKKIVTACPGCNTRYNQFQSGKIEVLYYTQLLARYVRDIRLDSQVNFYEGCHKYHRTASFKIDTTNSKSLISGMKDLDVTDIPNYCCRNLADKIFEKSDAATIVTPTSCCWTFLGNQRKADSPQVIPLTQLMCQALGLR